MSDKPKIPILEEGNITMISRKDAIIRLLTMEKKWLTSRDIASKLGMAYTTIHPYIVELAKQNKILKRTVRRHKAGRRPNQWGCLGMKED